MQNMLLEPAQRAEYLPTEIQWKRALKTTRGRRAFIETDRQTGRKAGRYHLHSHSSTVDMNQGYYTQQPGYGPPPPVSPFSIVSEGGLLRKAASHSIRKDRATIRSSRHKWCELPCVEEAPDTVIVTVASRRQSRRGATVPPLEAAYVRHSSLVFLFSLFPLSLWKRAAFRPTHFSRLSL